MSARSAEQLMYEFRTNAAADVTMSLLRSPHATLHLALMAVHLGDGQIVDGQTLAAAINADLPALVRDAAQTGSDEGVEVMDAGRLLGGGRNVAGSTAASIPRRGLSATS